MRLSRRDRKRLGESMNIEEYRDAQRPEEVVRKRYEQECGQVYSGHLNAHDVCRLFSTQPYSTWSSKPGQTAKALVEDLGLPLMEVGSGRWMVAHVVEGLEVPHG